MRDHTEREARLLSRITARARGSAVSPAVVCDVCVAETGVDGAALSVTGRGIEGRELLHTTDPLSARMEELQFTLGEGPCVDAYAAGGPILAPDLRSAAGRAAWPGFAGEAHGRGVLAMFAIPLQAGGIRLGALDLYRWAPGPLSPAQLADAVCLAGILLGVLLDGQSGASPVSGDGLPGSADHVEIHQATGMISVQLGVSLEVALTRLRAYTYAHDRVLHEVAGDIVARRLRLDPEGV